MHGGLVSFAKGRELSVWAKFEVSKLGKEGALSKSVVHTCWALTWKMVEGEKDAKARPAARGRHAPDLKGGLVETSGCVGHISGCVRHIPGTSGRRFSGGVCSSPFLSHSGHISGRFGKWGIFSPGR